MPLFVAAVKGRLFALMRRELTLMKRNLVVYRAKVMQVGVIALVAATLYLRTHIHPVSPNDGQEIAGFLFFSTLVMLFNGIAELSLTVSTCNLLSMDTKLPLDSCTLWWSICVSSSKVGLLWCT